MIWRAGVGKKRTGAVRTKEGNERKKRKMVPALKYIPVPDGRNEKVTIWTIPEKKNTASEVPSGRGHIAEIFCPGTPDMGTRLRRNGKSQKTGL